MKNIVAIVLTAMVLSGCATNPNAPTLATAPAPESGSEKAILYIYREYAQPTAWSAYLEIDEQEAVSLAQQGFTWVYVNPGKHSFKYGWPMLASMPSVTFERTFEAGKAYAFEMKGGISMVGNQISGGTVTSTSAIQPSSIESAKQKMNACCRYVAPQKTAF